MNEKNERLCVVMPVYNEQEAIGPVLRKWDSMLKGIGIDYEIRPYNDGSRDDSLVVMRKIGESLEKVNVRDKPNGGHGNTILTGYRDAVADGFDWIFQVDSDDEMGPEKFGELWAKRGEYDFLERRLLVGTDRGIQRGLLLGARCGQQSGSHCNNSNYLFHSHSNVSSSYCSLVALVLTATHWFNAMGTSIKVGVRYFLFIILKIIKLQFL